jgi:hypothetical protein
MDILDGKQYHRDITLELNLFPVGIKYIFLPLDSHKSIVLGLDMDNNNLSQECSFYTTMCVYYQMFLNFYHSIHINHLENKTILKNISFVHLSQEENLTYS